MRTRGLSAIIFCVAILSCGKRELNVGCNEFEFKNLNKDTNKWKDEIPFERVTESFFEKQIFPIRELRHVHRKSFYKVCEITTDNLKGVVIAALNGPAWNMFFIPESGGSAFELACFEVSPDEYSVKKSKLSDDGILEMTMVHFSYSDSLYVQDSVFTRYAIEENWLKRIKSDSVRTAIEIKRQKYFDPETLEGVWWSDKNDVSAVFLIARDT